MDDTAEYEQQVEPPAIEPALPERSPFDPWVGIGYHIIQVIFLVAAFIIAARLAGGDLQIGVAQARTGFLFTLGVIGVPAIGMAIALRLGQLDLSVAAMATFGMAIYAANDGGSSALLTVIGTALVIGAVTGAVSGLLRIPGWLSTLVLSFVLLARFYELVGPDAVLLGGEPSAETMPRLAVVFFAAGIGAAVVFLALDVIRRPAQVKRTEDVTLGARILLATGALAISAGLAAFTGVMQAERLRVVNAPGLESILPAILAAVLIGGVGVFGARVSVAGTMLGAAGMALLQFGAQLGGVEFATRMYATVIPLAVFLVLRGAVGALRGERLLA